MSAGGQARDPQAELAVLLADWRKTADSLKDRHGTGDARERNVLEVVIGQVEAITAGMAAQRDRAAAQQPQAAPAFRMVLGRCPVHAGKVHAQIGDDDEWFCLRDLADTAEAVGADELTQMQHAAAEPQPAPELAAAMAETASKELAAAMRESRRFREGIEHEASQLETSARISEPSRKSEIEKAVAARLRKILEGKS